MSSNQYRLSDLWDLGPNEIVQRLAFGMGDGDAYGDWGLHVVAILQAKVAQEVSERTRRLVWATWALAATTGVLAVTTVIIAFVA